MKNRLDHVRGWIKKGDNDYLTLQLIVDNEGPYDVACFHAQQAVEKYLKGLLAFLSDEALPRTHDIEELQEICLKYVPQSALKDLILYSLTDYGVIARYDFDFEPEKGVVNEARKLMETVREIILSHIPDLQE